MSTNTRPNATKRRARPLTRDRIVEAALKLADDSGDFSMRALGGRLQVDPMAIYRHFRGKDALQDAMVESVLAGFEPPPDSGPAVERLRLMCQGLRVAIGKHPGTGLRAAMTLLNLSSHSLELTEAALTLLADIGLDRDQAALAYLSLIRFISGVASAEDQLRAAGQQEDELHDAMRDAYSSVPSDVFPHVSEIAESLSRRSFDEQFEYGVDALLAGFLAKKKSL